MSERETRPWDLLNPERPRASDITQKKRMDICEECPLYQPLLHRCSDCGCIMPLKTKLADAYCPKGKWLAE